MRVIVCGGRDFDDKERMAEILDELHLNMTFECVIEGGATGADRMARAWAEKRGIPVIEVPANWTYFNNQAGPIRNLWMARLCSPDMIVAFPGGRGTEDMIRVAGMHGIAVHMVARAGQDLRRAV